MPIVSVARLFPRPAFPLDARFCHDRVQPDVVRLREDRGDAGRLQSDADDEGLGVSAASLRSKSPPP